MPDILQKAGGFGDGELLRLRTRNRETAKSQNREITRRGRRDEDTSRNREILRNRQRARSREIAESQNRENAKLRNRDETLGRFFVHLERRDRRGAARSRPQSRNREIKKSRIREIKNSRVARDADWRSHSPISRSRVDRHPLADHLGKLCCPTCRRNYERPHTVSAHGPQRSRITRRREVRTAPRDNMETEVNREIEEANREIGMQEGVSNDAGRTRGQLHVPQAVKAQLPQTYKALASGHLLKPASDPTSTPENNSLQPLTYAAVAARGAPKVDDTSKGGRRTTQGRPKLGRPVDPMKEGRCLRSLARGHTVRECREPIRCRLCHQIGHRQTSCPQQQTPRHALPGSGLFACLVGEIHDADPPWEHILESIRSTCPELTNPDCHLLESGQAFLRGISKKNWQRLHGISWQLPKGGSISWRRPHNADGALVRPRSTKTVEIRGVPFGDRKWRQLEVILQPIGDLCKIGYNGVQRGDPNCLCVDVKMEADKEVPQKLLVKTGAGALTELRLAVLPPPPTIPTPPNGPQSAAISAHNVALPQASPEGEQISIKQPACAISPNQSRRRAETDIETGYGNPEAETEETEATPGPEPNTSKTMAREGETQGDGPRDSLLMYRSRRARRDTNMTAGECQSWLAMTEERQGFIGRAVTQTAHQASKELDPPEPMDSFPPVTRTSPSGPPNMSFIPESILLLPASDVAHQMGAEDGVLPNLP